MCSKTLKCVSDLKGWECIKNMENDMARNTERDEREATRRKEQLMKAGFKLFSENGIENVSLQKVADAADVGVATMYKYYQTKVKLVVAISGKIWGDIWKSVLAQNGPDFFENFTAYEYIEFYLDMIIRLYREKPEMLRFSNNYKNFIYHKLYEQAKVDHSIRTDLSEQELFTTVAIAMLAVAERYAQGIVWANDHKTDHTQELKYLKEMLLMWCKGKTE